MPDRVTRILAIRHGETDWNRDTRIQGYLDIGLNATGRWQAGRLAAALVDEDIAAVYSSDLARAHDTAQPLAAGIGLPVQLRPALRERAFGAFEGQTYQQIEQRWPADCQRWRQRDPDFAPEGGESLTAFYGRCVDAAATLAAAHPGQTVVLVSHGGVLDCLYRAATRISLQAPRTWTVTNASINRLLHTEAGFGLVGWADSSHLDGIAEDETSDGALATDHAGPAAG
jgi:probable phosphoglycerate mutase